MATIRVREQRWAITGANFYVAELRQPHFWQCDGDVAGLDAPSLIPAGSTVKNSGPYEGCEDVFVIGRLASRTA
ncbi:hypothetical protein [Achromobacter xylosoxidans]|uniref:Uncharacterized protein n=1 Tax=Alcaligenes xylosoxydans xylosoxydans TaxID=85698 RepID=A0A1R1JUJ5_ALCXX|nr:hypothetical protein [Achromobacter xylosoxidans]OMG87988.1 hypothetical protein BIZ92_10345 [Achromobacter xylosoxidans]